ncbi:hypothetical protein EYC56_03755 [Xanthomonas oryzae]|nr:hypothetical protein EYC56_03755 [Xanthomonas oryzae]
MQAQLTRCRNFCWCEGTGVKPDLRAANKTTTQLSGGRGRRDQNRSGRVVDADSEHRPRPPDSCSLGFVSRSTWSPLKNPQTTSIARLHLRYRCAGIASFRYATSWFLAVFAHAYTPSCRRAVACR